MPDMKIPTLEQMAAEWKLILAEHPPDEDEGPDEEDDEEDEDEDED